MKVAQVKKSRSGVGIGFFYWENCEWTGRKRKTKLLEGRSMISDPEVEYECLVWSDGGWFRKPKQKLVWLKEYEFRLIDVEVEDE